MTLTQKETTLLEDLKKQEQTCVEKYSQYSSQASDSQLKSLFSQIQQKEQQHLDTLNQILSGQVPNVSSGSGSSMGQSGGQSQSGQSQSVQGSQSQSSGSSWQSSQSGSGQSSSTSWQAGSSSGQGSQGASSSTQNDSYLCTDALSTEKHVSSTYNTTIFEFKDVNIRNVLNHIQKEEQEHGEQIYSYMAQHGMYNA